MPDLGYHLPDQAPALSLPACWDPSRPPPPPSHSGQSLLGVPALTHTCTPLTLFPLVEIPLPSCQGMVDFLISGEEGVGVCSPLLPPSPRNPRVRALPL